MRKNRHTTGQCSAPGCPRPDIAKGFCQKHYARMQRNGDLELHPKAAAGPHLCFARDCERLVEGKPYCPRHNYRRNKFGDPNANIHPDRAKAFRSELNLISIFRSKKHKAELLPYVGAGGDILVDHRLRIEVKTADPHVKRGLLSWFFNIHRHGILNEKSDYYIFEFRNVPGFKKPIYAAFKSPLGMLTVVFSIKSLILRLGPAVELFNELTKTPEAKNSERAA